MAQSQPTALTVACYLSIKLKGQNESANVKGNIPRWLGSNMKAAIVSVFTAFILLVGYNIGLTTFKASCEAVGVSQDKPEWLECPLK